MDGRREGCCIFARCRGEDAFPGKRRGTVGIVRCEIFGDSRIREFENLGIGEFGNLGIGEFENFRIEYRRSLTFGFRSSIASATPYYPSRRLVEITVEKVREFENLRI